MTKRFLLMPFMLLAGLFLMITYSFGGQASLDNLRYYAQDDESSYCCCKISEGDSDGSGTYGYQNTSEDDCAAQGGACVADNYCKQ
jgi:hypothetical protein